MNQPLTPERIAEIRELATRAALSSYEAVTSQRGIEISAIDPDDFKERIAATPPDRKDFVYLAVQAPTVVLALLKDLDRVRAERDELRDDLRYATDRSRMAHEQLRTAETERDELKKRLHDAAMTRTWTNEDGKKFVFVEDIAPPLLGRDR